MGSVVLWVLEAWHSAADRDPGRTVLAQPQAYRPQAQAARHSFPRRAGPRTDPTQPGPRAGGGQFLYPRAEAPAGPLGAKTSCHLGPLSAQPEPGRVEGKAGAGKSQTHSGACWAVAPLPGEHLLKAAQPVALNRVHLNQLCRQGTAHGTKDLADVMGLR